MTDQSTPQYTFPQMLPGRIHDIGGELKLKQRVQRLEGLLGDLLGVIKPLVVTAHGAQGTLDEIAGLLKGNERDVHYVMGRADPVASRTPGAPGTPKSVTYWSPSGVDTDVYVCRQGKISCMSRLQGISWCQDQGQARPIIGSMISIIMGSDHEKNFSLFDKVPMDLDWILLRALDEFGHVAWLAIADVHIHSRNGGASIDDIVIDDGWTFGASNMFGWIKDAGLHVVIEGGKKSGRVIGYELTEAAAKILDPYTKPQ